MFKFIDKFLLNRKLKQAQKELDEQSHLDKDLGNGTREVYDLDAYTKAYRKVTLIKHEMKQKGYTNAGCQNKCKCK